MTNNPKENSPALVHPSLLREVFEATVQTVLAALEAPSIAPGQPPLPPEQLPDFISGVYTRYRALALGQALLDVPTGPAQAESAAGPVKPIPAVPVAESVTPAAVVCLHCGKPMSMLKRHLRTLHGQTPEEYKAMFGLTDDYPLVAPAYRKEKSDYARAIGLGTHGFRSRSNAHRRRRQRM